MVPKRGNWQKSQETKKEQKSKFTLFFGKKFALRLELWTLPRRHQGLTVGPQIELDLLSNINRGFTRSISTDLSHFPSWQKQFFMGIMRTCARYCHGSTAVPLAIPHKSWFCTQAVCHVFYIRQNLTPNSMKPESGRTRGSKADPHICLQRGVGSISISVRTSPRHWAYGRM